jgi:ribosome-associated protein
MANAAETQVAPVEPEHLLELVQSSLGDDKAEDLVVVDLAEKSNMADFMVIASGRSTRQVGAMAENLRERLKAEGIAGVSIEGAGRCDWVLLDAGDVIVHLFRPEVRVFYNLEKMWGLELPKVKAEEASAIDPLDRPQA